ncbi:EF_hand domain-containing protein [Hexamita inflata]|uniref:EF hand domain-containing protein n=1 Tax=Hexamita inflata TaxID=28002 RepID=A0AA86U166_9EUKA|nr:EF hand domain-containing protein [Hexamita inflata]CAI9959186.1 EF hand domain-containing protein [Hexamita inflata]
MPKIEKPDFKACEKAFKAIDKDNSGELDLNELEEAFGLLDIHMKKDEIKGILEIVDADGDNKMNKTEFAHFVYICKNATPDDVKTILFLAADQDCSMTIDKNELLIILKKLGAEVDKAQVDELVKQVADNDDGTLSYEMFLAMMEKLLE